MKWRETIISVRRVFLAMALNRVSVLIMMMVLGGCASTQRVSLTTIPAGADAYVNGTFAGKTPVVAELTCNRRHVVRFDLDGYVSFEQDVPTQQGFSASNPLLTWVETQCVPGVHVPLRAEKK
jgi:hypothetical protein